MTRPLSLLLVAFATIAGGLITHGVLVALSTDQTSLIFVVGAVIGSQVAAWRIHADCGVARAPLSTMLLTGAVLSVSNVALGLALQFFAAPFVYADITIGIAAVGSLFFPFAIVNTMLKALNQKAA